MWGYFSSTSNLYVKVRVKGVDVNDLIVKKINQNKAIYKANIFYPLANIQVNVDLINK